MQTKKITIAAALPYVLVIGGTIGLLASLILAIERFELAKNPTYQATCNLNPVFSCTTVASTPQAAVFGFPNMFIGLACFAMVIAVGMMLFAGGGMRAWFWRWFNLGVLGGIVFVHWLIWQTLYAIGALCLYCMMVWAVMMPIFWYTTLYNLQQGTLPLAPNLLPIREFVLKYHGVLLASWYFILLLLIVQRFWDFFSTLF